MERHCLMSEAAEHDSRGLERNISGQKSKR